MQRVGRLFSLCDDFVRIKSKDNLLHPNMSRKEFFWCWLYRPKMTGKIQVFDSPAKMVQIYELLKHLPMHKETIFTHTSSFYFFVCVGWGCIWIQHDKMSKSNPWYNKMKFFQSKTIKGNVRNVINYLSND